MQGKSQGISTRVTSFEDYQGRRHQSTVMQEWPQRGCSLLEIEGPGLIKARGHRYGLAWRSPAVLGAQRLRTGRFLISGLWFLIEGASVRLISRVCPGVQPVEPARRMLATWAVEGYSPLECIRKRAQYADHQEQHSDLRC